MTLWLAIQKVFIQSLSWLCDLPQCKSQLLSVLTWLRKPVLRKLWKRAGWLVATCDYEKAMALTACLKKCGEKCLSRESRKLQKHWRRKLALGLLKPVHAYHWQKIIMKNIVCTLSLVLMYISESMATAIEIPAVACCDAATSSCIEETEACIVIALK